MDTYTALLELVSKEVALTQQDELLLRHYFVPGNFLRGMYLLEQGNVADGVFFIASGITHQFYEDTSGGQTSCNFSFAKDFITDLESFNAKRPSLSNIVALTPVSALCISCDRLMELISLSPAVHTFFRLVVERVAVEGIRRTKSLLSQSPEERFTELIATQPQVVHEIPQKLIAQYLGVKPESLSRIKRRIYKS